MSSRRARDLRTFESHRRDLVALAYRMLGDFGRAEDMVQEAWLRWSERDVEVESARAYLVTIVTRLCLNELASARARREAGRPDRLPEPIDLASTGMDRLERLEDVSMAFLVVLERLTPAERAVLLLHDVLDLAHEEIAVSLARTPASCRKLLERARSRVAAGRKLATASRAEHARLLDGFVRAASAGDAAALAGLLAEDAVLVTDGGAEGRTFGRYKNLRRPLRGRERIAALVARTSRRAGLEVVQGELNGEPAVLLTAAGRPAAAILVAARGGAIARVWFCADAARLHHVGDAQRRQPSRKRRKSSRAIG